MHIPRITDFTSDGCNPDRYVELDGDWHLAVADVVSSTVLASQGRDRAVNFVAGSVVAVLSEVLSGAGPAGSPSRRDEPTACQFGGDGAIVAVPPGGEDEAREALAALAHWAETDIGIALRVGLVPVSALREQGFSTMAALHDFGGGNVLGLFLGHGVIEAERWVKQDARWRIPPKPGPLPGIEGLSCRWDPVPSRRGTVLSVIVDPAHAGRVGITALARAHERIRTIVAPETSAPFGRGEHLVPPALPAWALIGLEARSRAGLAGAIMSRLHAIIGSALIHLSYRLGMRFGPVDAEQYLRAVACQSDHSKQGGGLRFVLDVTHQEADAIQAELEDREQAGEIVFGTARSDAATMTCLVGDFAMNRHVHFVDGGDLGFWRASAVLKAKLMGQMKA